MHNFVLIYLCLKYNNLFYYFRKSFLNYFFFMFENVLNESYPLVFDVQYAEELVADAQHVLLLGHHLVALHQLLPTVAQLLLQALVVAHELAQRLLELLHLLEAESIVPGSNTNLNFYFIICSHPCYLSGGLSGPQGQEVPQFCILVV